MTFHKFKKFADKFENKFEDKWDDFKEKLEDKFDKFKEKFEDKFEGKFGDKFGGKDGDHHDCPCFTPGTMIRTPNGEVAVETLKAGDLVETLDGGAQPIRWVGQFTVDAEMLAAQPQMRPIRIRAGALGENLPAADLTVSPEHAALVEDWRAELVADSANVLVPAKLLVNDETIRPVEVEQVTYIHLLFDAHQIVFSNGAPTESYRPCGQNYSAFDADRQQELLSLFPELAEDGMAYGPAARPVLREGDMEAMRAL